MTAPGWERSTSLPRDHGQLECTKSCSVPSRIGPGPPRAGGFRAEPSWRRGLLLQGSRPLHPPAARQGGMVERGAQGGQAGGQEEMTLLAVELGHGIIGKRPPPIAEVSATGLPSNLAGGCQRAE